MHLLNVIRCTLCAAQTIHSFSSLLLILLHRHECELNKLLPGKQNGTQTRDCPLVFSSCGCDYDWRRGVLKCPAITEGNY